MSSIFVIAYDVPRPSLGATQLLNYWHRAEGTPQVIDTVGANPHFIGRYTSPVFNRIALNTLAADYSIVPPLDNPVNFIGKFTAPVFNRIGYSSIDNQGLPQVLDTVGANPHFVGKFTSPTFNRIAYNSATSDILPIPALDIPQNFIAKFQAPIFNRAINSWDNQGTPQVFATEIPVNFIAKHQPVQFLVNSNAYLSSDTGILFVPPAFPTLGGKSEWTKKLEEYVQARIRMAAQHMSSMGGHARAQSLTPTQRSRIAYHAAKTRWK